MEWELLVNLHDEVGESPLWSPSEQALWWVDIHGQKLHRLDWASRGTRSWPVPERIGCIALHGTGGLVAALQSGLFHLQPQEDGRLDAQPLAAFTHARPDMRGNDGRCDRAGRFFIGTMVGDTTLGIPAGTLLRYDQHGLSAPLLTGLITPNGLGFSPDNRRMYLSDSHPDVQRIWVFDLDSDGTPLNRREWVDMRPLPGRPDGAAVDAEGGYWICGNDAGLVHRFTPDGRLARSLAVPVSKPSMCAFAGPGLDWLAVTSILHIYRIAEEAVGNAIRHSGATKIAIELTLDGRRQLKLVISDNGKGFDRKAVTEGMGVGNMTYRASVIGGSLQIESSGGNGTRVECSVPLGQISHDCKQTTK